MTFIPFPTGTVEVAVQMTLHGIPCEVTLGAKKTGGGAADPTDGGTLATAIATWFNDSVKADVLDACILTQVVVNDLTSESGWTGSYIANIAGTSGGTDIANQVAMCITLQSGIRGRSYRGRNYWPGLSAEDMLDSTTWKTARVTAWNTNYDDLEVAIAGAGFDWSILSRFLDKSPRSEGHVQIITGHRANAHIATIRGRLS